MHQRDIKLFACTQNDEKNLFSQFLQTFANMISLAYVNIIFGHTKCKLLGFPKAILKVPDITDTDTIYLWIFRKPCYQF